MPHLSVKGVQLHYALEGSEGAPVVALSNSLSTDLRMWNPQMPALAAKYRVLRYDVRARAPSPGTDTRSAVSRSATRSEVSPS